MTAWCRAFFALLLVAALLPACAAPVKRLSHPRPSGYAEAHAAPAPAQMEFQAQTKDAGFTYDLVAHFPKGSPSEFEVERVVLNGTPQETFVVRNEGVLNLGHRVHGMEDFTIAVLSHWTPGTHYAIEVTGTDASGKPVKLEQDGTAPAERSATRGLSFGTPTGEFPYHHATLTLSKDTVSSGTVTAVEIDGQRNRDARFFNGAEKIPHRTKEEGETYTGEIAPGKDFSVTVPVNWTGGSQHTVKVTVKGTDGQEKQYEATGTAPGSGGYWNKDWPSYFSITVAESAGILRDDEPVHVMLGAFADDIGDPAKEIRVVTYDPTSPDAGPDGYVQAPWQLISSTEWRNEKMLKHEERDAETGELVHRYDPTQTVELLFFADVLPYQTKVYEVVYGNAAAQAPSYTGDLYVRQGPGLSQTIGNKHFEMLTSQNSGALETVTIKGEGEPVLLEHKLETNGAVHWNPDFYSPPTPWVHVSDWEQPEAHQATGPLMHRTWKYAPLPQMNNVFANISYTFYAGQPYVLYTSLMEVQEDMFVAALRNNELVFNKAVLNEFVWLDDLGKIQSLKIENARQHPVHAVDINPRTEWMAFINREKGVGFANIALDYVNTNRYGDMASEAQPYIYVENGPWVYWSRGMVYPFAGNNMTRLMPVRKGSMYYEKNAWVPFRLGTGDQMFAAVEETAQKLKHPLYVHEWMPTHKLAPEKWIMPILTAPFNEGVAGAVSAHKETGNKE